MVIDPGNNISSQSAANRARNQAPARAEQAYGAGTGAANTAGQSGGDSVSLSSESRALSRVEANLSQVSDVDTAKVAKIKAAIDSGNYTVDTQAIANKIQGEEQLLG